MAWKHVYIALAHVRDTLQDQLTLICGCVLRSKKRGEFLLFVCRTITITNTNCLYRTTWLKLLNRVVYIRSHDRVFDMIPVLIIDWKCRHQLKLNWIQMWSICKSLEKLIRNTCFGVDLFIETLKLTFYKISKIVLWLKLVTLVGIYKSSRLCLWFLPWLDRRYDHRYAVHRSPLSAIVVFN